MSLKFISLFLCFTIFTIGTVYGAEVNFLNIAKEYYSTKQYTLAINALFENLRKNKSGQSETFYYLGLMYFYGHGVKQNYAKALRYFKKSLSSGIFGAYYNAAIYLGIMYYRGLGAKQNFNIAKTYFEKEIFITDNNLLAIANLCLGYMYLSGTGCQKDYDKSIEYLEKAVRFGAIQTYGLLAKVYYNNKLDYFKARKYAEKSILLNDPIGYYVLSLVYNFGKGVPVNELKALFLMEKACENGCRDACEKYKEMVLSQNIVDNDEIKKLLRDISEMMRSLRE